MIIENTGYKGIKSELSYLDEITTNAGFVRWQWEKNRATYDYKIIDTDKNEEYFLRVNARVVEGQLEQKDAVLSIEDTYIGKTTFPHGLDYNVEPPKKIMEVTNKKVSELKLQLT